MGGKLEHLDPRSLYLSLFIILVLAVVTHLSTDEIVAIVFVFFIRAIALGNIAYLYSKFKKHVGESQTL
jgi:hypothetical protein